MTGFGGKPGPAPAPQPATYVFTPNVTTQVQFWVHVLNGDGVGVTNPPNYSETSMPLIDVQMIAGSAQVVGTQSPGHRHRQRLDIDHIGDALIGQAQALVGRVLAHQADPACREEVDVDGVAAGPSGRSPDFHEAREVRPCGLEVHGKHPAVCGLSLIRQWTSGMLLRHTVCPSSILHQFPPCPRPSPS